MEKVAVIIVGQGMAGTALAVELAHRNISFKVIDDHHQSSSSVMSAGMYNPIVFKRVTKSWKTDEVLPVFRRFCEQISDAIGVDVHTSTDVIRLFANLTDQNTWYEKMDNPLFDPFLKEGFKDALPISANAPFGHGEVKQAGAIDMPVMLAKYQAHLVKNSQQWIEAFDYDALTFAQDSWVYQNRITAENIVFCEGHKALDNPFFQWVPIKPNKGQLIVVKCAELKLEKVLNSGFFIQPLGNDLYRVGATYEWDKTDSTPTEEQKQALLAKFKAVVNAPVEVVSHTAGIRPTVTDRRPLLGEHPEKKGLFIFNGFGTKAVMLAPYHAIEFLDFLLNNKALDKEVDLARYYKLYRSDGIR